MKGRDGPWVEPFGATGDVVVHVLAHAPIPGVAPIVVRAGSLHDPRYVAWARDALPIGAVEPAATDGALLGSLLASAPEAVAIQQLLVAFDDDGALGAALRLPASEAADPALRDRALAAPSLWEIAWAAIGLAWPAYRDAWCSAIAPQVELGRVALEQTLAGLVAALPVVARERVRLSHPIGPRARCFDDAIVVGVPGSWCGLDAVAIAARVVHEVVVRHAARLVAAREPELDAAAHWARTEGLALEAAARRLAGSSIATGHAAFVASLDCAGVRPPSAEEVTELLEALDG